MVQVDRSRVPFLTLHPLHLDFHKLPGDFPRAVCSLPAAALAQVCSRSLSAFACSFRIERRTLYLGHRIARNHLLRAAGYAHCKSCEFSRTSTELQRRT